MMENENLNGESSCSLIEGRKLLNEPFFRGTIRQLVIQNHRILDMNFILLEKLEEIRENEIKNDEVKNETD